MTPQQTYDTLMKLRNRRRMDDDSVAALDIVLNKLAREILDHAGS